MKPIADYIDREMLELAAAYCGYEYRPQNGCIVVDGLPCKWNPITDAGDRARMCDELQLDMLHCQSTGEVTVSSSKPTKWHRERYSDHNGSRTTTANYAAVRLVAKIELAKRGEK